MELFIIFLIVVAIILFINSGTNEKPRKKINNRPKRVKRRNVSPNRNSSNLPKIPPLKSQNDLWIKKGRSIKISGYKIDGGMIYVGKNLPSVLNDYYGNNIEPALIDPSKPVNRNQPDYDGNGLGYWSSYHSIPSESRAAFLEWLASDRNNPDIPIGYVFLYLYGLERRILHDAQNSQQAKNELPELISEVERLIRIYGSNNSFRRYTSGLLEFGKLSTDPKQVFKNPLKTENLDFSEYYGTYYDYSLNFKMGLSYFAVKEKPIPADWALKWGLYHYSLRTPAVRCKNEFQQLFSKKYHEKFERGLFVKRNKTNIKISYRPASSSFGYKTFTATTNLPDLTVLSKPVNKIESLINECTDLLDPYSRYVGRNPNDGDSVEAISNLPRELIKDSLSPRLEEFITLLDKKLEGEKFALLKTEHFTKYWEIKGVNKYRKRESIEIAQFLFKLGYGIEPDLRFGSAKFERDSRVIVFRLNPETFPKAPSKEYKLALPIVHLTSVVGLADGKLTQDEEEHIDQYIESIFQLTEEERIRLDAYLNWIKAENPGVTGLKNKIKNLDEEKRESILQFLIKIADADGYISPGEVDTLQKVAEIFEIDPDKVYTAIHSRQTSEEDPILIVKGEKEEGFDIPKENESSIGINQNIVEQTLKETDEVQSILSDIFEEEEDEEQLKETQNEEDLETILGLDEVHSSLLNELCSKPNWSKVEYENLCSNRGIFSNGALELINEKSYEEFDDVLLIESDRIELNMEIASKLK